DEMEIAMRGPEALRHFEPALHTEPHATPIDEHELGPLPPRRHELARRYDIGLFIDLLDDDARAGSRDDDRRRRDRAPTAPGGTFRLQTRGRRPQRRGDLLGPDP